MVVEDDGEGVLGRWSRRKAEARSARPPGQDDTASKIEQRAAAQGLDLAGPPAPEVEARQGKVASQPAAQAAPLPTLADVHKLALDGDFKPFVARGVPAEVRNAALKKLFTDPHYNVMDGLDIYIDDYSIPSPLPAAMLAKMVSARVMKLVDDPDEPKATEPTDEATAAGEAPAEPSSDTQQPDAEAEAIAQPSGDVPATPEETRDTEDDDADLQLQPNHAARPDGAGPGTG